MGSGLVSVLIAPGLAVGPMFGIERLALGNLAGGLRLDVSATVRDFLSGHIRQGEGQRLTDPCSAPSLD